MERELILNVNSEKIRAGLRKVDSSLKNTERRGNTTGRSLSKAGDKATTSFNRLGSAIGAAALGMATLSFAKTIGGLQALDRSLGVVFQSAERGTAVFKDLQTMALQTPFSIEQLSNSVIKLRAAGIEPTNAQLALFADVASVTTDKIGTLNAITDLFSRTTAGGLGLEDLNRLADRGIPVFDILSQKMGLARLEVAKFGQSADGAQQILKVLTDEMETRFGGAAADAARDLTNQISNMGIAWTDFQQSLGAAGGMTIMTGIVVAATGAIIFFTENLDTLAIVIGGLSTLAIPAMITGIKALTVAMAANPVGMFIIGLTAVMATAWQFRDVILEAIEKPLLVTIPSAVDYASIAFLSLKKSIGETLNGILGKINEFGNNLITKAPVWLQEFFGINGQTFSLGIDIAKVDAEMAALELTINNRIANYKPFSYGDKITTGLGGGEGLSTDPSLTGVAVDSKSTLTPPTIEQQEEDLSLFEDQYATHLNAYAAFQDKQTEIANAAEKARMTLMTSNLGAASSIFSSLSQLAGKEGEKANKKQKVLAKASIIASTAQSIMRTMAEFGYPVGLPFAAAAALQGAVQLRAVGAGGSIAETTAPVSSATSLAATPIATPTQVVPSSQSVIQFTGNWYGVDERFTEELIERIADNVENNDTILIPPTSRNGEDLMVIG